MEVAYRPPGPVVKSFLLDDSFVRGLKGPFGSGKSTGCVVDIVRRAQMQRPGFDGVKRSRWAAIRNTYPELASTTIKTWHQWVPPTLGRWRDQGPPTHHIRVGDLDLEVIFLALDRPEDVRRLLSMELTGAWVNEARELPRAVIEGLTGRVGRFPSAAMGGTAWSGIIMDTNPPDSDHWWYKLAEEMKPEGYRFFNQPSGLSPEAENLMWLNQSPETLVLPEDDPVRLKAGRGYYERLVAGKTEEWINVYVHGNYGFVMDGKPVYPEFRDNVHVRECSILPGMPVYIGIDFGLTPAATFAQRTPMGGWRVHSELVSEDMGAKRFGEEIRRHLAEHYSNLPLGNITGDPSGDIRAQSDETTPFLMLRAQEIDAQPAHTNDPVIRREAVVECMGRLIDGEPGLVIHPRCKTLRKGMGGGYHYRRLQVSGSERYKDVPDKDRFSHVCESLQYLVLGAGEGKALIRRDPTVTQRQRVNRPRTAIMDYDLN